jgi:hypothetical protein
MNNELTNGETVSQTLKDGWRLSIRHVPGQVIQLTPAHFLSFTLQCDPNVAAQFNGSGAVLWSINHRNLSTGFLTEGFMRGAVT